MFRKIIGAILVLWPLVAAMGLLLYVAIGKIGLVAAISTFLLALAVPASIFLGFYILDKSKHV